MLGFIYSPLSLHLPHAELDRLGAGFFDQWWAHAKLDGWGAGFFDQWWAHAGAGFSDQWWAGFLDRQRAGFPVSETCIIFMSCQWNTMSPVLVRSWPSPAKILLFLAERLCCTANMGGGMQIHSSTTPDCLSCWKKALKSIGALELARGARPPPPFFPPPPSD